MKRLSFFQARLLYGWRTFLVQNGYSEPRWDLSVLQSASQSVVHNITSAFTPLQGTVIKFDSSCLSLWAHNLLQGSVNIDGIRTLWFSYHDPLISEGSRHGVGTSSKKCSWVMGVPLHSSCDSPSRSLHKGKTKVMSMTHVAKQKPVCWIDEQLLEKGRFKSWRRGCNKPLSWHRTSCWSGSYRRLRSPNKPWIRLKILRIRVPNCPNPLFCSILALRIRKE